MMRAYDGRTESFKDDVEARCVIICISDPTILMLIKSLKFIGSSGWGDIVDHLQVLDQVPWGHCLSLAEGSVARGFLNGKMKKGVPK